MSISKGIIGGIVLVLGLIFLLFNLYPSVFKAVYWRLFESCIVECDITYRTIDNIDLKMDIYYRQNIEKSRPAVVYIHGGGWYSGDKSGGAGQIDIPELVAHGYLVAAVNYRLAPRYKFPAQIEDVKCSIRFYEPMLTLMA